MLLQPFKDDSALSLTRIITFWSRKSLISASDKPFSAMLFNLGSYVYLVRNHLKFRDISNTYRVGIDFKVACFFCDNFALCKS
jgi:hypothetical protein